MQRSCHQRQTCLQYGKMPCFHVERRYDQFCMYTHMLMNHVNDCHGDRAFFQSANKLIFMDNHSLHFIGVSMNDLAAMKNCHGGGGGAR